MSNKTVLTCTCLICIILLGACKSKKKIVTKEIEKGEAVLAGSSAYFIGELRRKQASFEHFSTRAKTTLILNDDKHDVTLSIRIKDKQAIWISVTAILGLEVARVLITPDSLHIIDRMNSTYIGKPFDELYKFSSTQLSFGDLQSILVGNAISPALDDSITVRQTDSTFIFSGKTPDMNFALQTAMDFSTRINQINNPSQQQSLVINYSDYALFKQKNIPQRIKIKSEAAAIRLFVNMAYDRVEIDNPVQMPFSVPGKYRKAAFSPAAKKPYTYLKTALSL